MSPKVDSSLLGESDSKLFGLYLARLVINGNIFQKMFLRGKDRLQIEGFYISDLLVYPIVLFLRIIPYSKRGGAVTGDRVHPKGPLFSALD